MEFSSWLRILEFYVVQNGLLNYSPLPFICDDLTSFAAVTSRTQQDDATI